MDADLKDPISIRTIHKTVSALRKIGDDLVIEVAADHITFRALNGTRSALPIVEFKSTFFHNYSFKASNLLIYQVPVQALTTAFKCVVSATQLRMVVHKETSKFHVELTDKFNIVHDWELFLGETAMPIAVYDLSDATVQIQSHPEVFRNLSDAFRRHETVALEVNRGDNMVFRSVVADDQILSSTLSIRRSDRCETQILREGDQHRAIFSLADFIVAIRIAELLGPRLSIFLMGPGLPIVIKASLARDINFNMALATMLEQPPDQEPHRDGTTGPSSITESGQTDSPPSQASPGQRGKTKSEWITSDERANASSEQGQPNTGSRPSQSVNQQLYLDSPPFARRRNMRGHVAYPSQPPSDCSDSEVP
jgi:hypothetical protein